MITHQHTVGVKSDSSPALSGTSAEVGSSEVVLSQVVPASTTNQALPIALAAANVQSLILKSSTDLTIKANSTSSPDFTLNLKAGRALVWRKSDGYFAGPIAANVTTLYLTNGAAATTFEGRILTS